MALTSTLIRVIRGKRILNLGEHTHVLRAVSRPLCKRADYVRHSEALVAEQGLWKFVTIKCLIITGNTKKMGHGDVKVRRLRGKDQEDHKEMTMQRKKKSKLNKVIYHNTTIVYHYYHQNQVQN